MSTVQKVSSSNAFNIQFDVVPAIADARRQSCETVIYIDTGTSSTLSRIISISIVDTTQLLSVADTSEAATEIMRQNSRQLRFRIMNSKLLRKAAENNVRAVWRS
jgi:hypothetical protein